MACIDLYHYLWRIPGHIYYEFKVTFTENSSFRYISVWIIKSIETRDVHKTLCPLKLFYQKCFVQLDYTVQNKLHKCMKKKFISGNCFLIKRSEMVLEHLILVTLTFDPVTPKSIGFLCCPGRMCGQSIMPLFFEGGHKKLNLRKTVNNYK